ncbi:MAG: dienelactone hydrolase family protein [Vicinamibacterales bacterium]
MTPHTQPRFRRSTVRVPVGDRVLHGDLLVPPRPEGVVLFAHGSGSSRHSPRNQYVAQELEERGFAALLIDLLTPEEEAVDVHTAEYRFDIALLTERLVLIIDWLHAGPATQAWPIGLFGASTGGAAAIVAASARPDEVRAVVSRGGRPDLAGAALSHCAAPTLLIVGGLDHAVLQMNEDAMRRMRGPVALEIVQGATHLFEETGALDRVALLAGDWFARYLPSPAGSAVRRPAAGQTEE